MNTTSLSRYTEFDGTEHLIVAVNDGEPEEITDERAEIIVEQRLATGWKTWRETRGTNGCIIDMLLIIQ